MNDTKTTPADQVLRWVPTYKRDKDGLRTLLLTCQGRYTYATRDEAQAVLDGLRPSYQERTGRGDEIRSAAEVASMRVDEVPCWAGHFDPVGVYVVGD